MYYYLMRLDKEHYYLVCLNYDSVLNYLNEIESEGLLQANEGTLLIDQLLVTGNGRNRFLSCDFSNGKLKLNSAKNVDGSKTFKLLTSQILFKYLDKIKHSILTDEQVEAIRHGCAV